MAFFWPLNDRRKCVSSASTTPDSFGLGMLRSAWRILCRQVCAVGSVMSIRSTIPGSDRPADMSSTYCLHARSSLWD